MQTLQKLFLDINLRINTKERLFLDIIMKIKMNLLKKLMSLKEFNNYKID